MNVAKKFVVGVVAVGLVTAFGLHATNLARLTTQTFRSAGLIEKTAING